MCCEVAQKGFLHGNFVTIFAETLFKKSVSKQIACNLFSPCPKNFSEKKEQTHF